MSMDEKTAAKVLYNMKLAEQTKDPRLFKKLKDNIWEFRIRYNKKQIRFLTFWENAPFKRSKVVVTHGFIKKTDKIPFYEIERAKQIQKIYSENN